MGADLISICLVSKSGGISEEQYQDAISYMDKLYKDALACIREKGDGPHYHLAKYPELKVAVIHTISWLRDIDEDWEKYTTEALELIMSKTKAPEEVLSIFNNGARDLNARVWNGAMIYYAGEMSWGDEPKGLGYQSLKWIELLHIDGKLGLE